MREKWKKKKKRGKKTQKINSISISENTTSAPIFLSSGSFFPLFHFSLISFHHCPSHTITLNTLPPLCLCLSLSLYSPPTALDPLPNSFAAPPPIPSPPAARNGEGGAGCTAPICSPGGCGEGAAESLALPTPSRGVEGLGVKGVEGTLEWRERLTLGNDMSFG